MRAARAAARPSKPARRCPGGAAQGAAPASPRQQWGRSRWQRRRRCRWQRRWLLRHGRSRGWGRPGERRDGAGSRRRRRRRRGSGDTPTDEPTAASALAAIHGVSPRAVTVADGGNAACDVGTADAPRAPLAAAVSCAVLPAAVDDNSERRDSAAAARLAALFAAHRRFNRRSCCCAAVATRSSATPRPFAFGGDGGGAAAAALPATTTSAAASTDDHAAACRGGPQGHQVRLHGDHAKQRLVLAVARGGTARYPRVSNSRRLRLRWWTVHQLFQPPLEPPSGALRRSPFAVGGERLAGPEAASAPPVVSTGHTAARRPEGTISPPKGDME
jgi:hypothetical protein